MTRQHARAARLLGAAVLAAGVTAALGPGTGGPRLAAAAPQAPGPAEVACAPGDGIVITSVMAAEVTAGEGHAVTPAGASVSGGSVSGGSVSTGCGHQHAEDELGWTQEAPDTPDDAASDEDVNDPFTATGGGQQIYSYQFGDFDGTGPPDYWEQPVALKDIGDWPGTVTVGYVLVDGATGASIARSLPRSGVCAYRGQVPAYRVPRRIASYRSQTGHLRIYLYDHVPLRMPANEFRNAGGGWYHYMCGASTPAGIAGPGGQLSAIEAVYYSTPHWVYARGWSASELDRLSPVWRAARAQAQVYDAVQTSPAASSVVALKVWMWAPTPGYQIRLGGLVADVRPTGIVVRAPGVPLHAHDLRRGACRDGGTPDTGAEHGSTDCYLVFDHVTGADPTDVYTVGFALRWTVTTRTAGGAPVGRPMTFWTTSVRQYRVGEVQVPVR